MGHPLLCDSHPLVVVCNDDEYIELFCAVC